MTELARQQFSQDKFVLSTYTTIYIKPERAKHMKVHGEAIGIDVSGYVKCIPLQDLRAELKRAELALTELNPHPADNHLVVVGVDGLKSIHLFNARTAGESVDLLEPDLVELAKQEREVARQAAAIATRIATTPASQGLTAEQVLQMIAQSSDRNLTIKAVRLAMNGGANVASEEGPHSAQVSGKMKSCFDSGTSHRLTVSVLGEVGDGQTLHVKLHHVHGKEEFWKQYNRRSVTLKVMDESDYQTLLLARISGQEIQMEVGVILHLPKSKNEKESVTCTLVGNLEREEIVKQALHWIGAQFNLKLDAG